MNTKNGGRSVADRVQKEAVKYINSADMQLVPEDAPEPDEIEAIKAARLDTAPTVPHNAIDWDT
ncbi:MAG: hypothetical protein LUC95_06455 [Lachnospiraceae bacterium]|nr:hypothetical protein [Lachnospiraceae bacterium]